ncbi:MAG TPA: 5'/3'-nucleotidase SurE [Casimicrobiaceae bacterium]|jgi:5'-nucleotidase|nr:5'/3'-nucleotidase SurE [Casimicrobiaceae bacterium]
MRILVCNDDGVEAPGLARLAAAARTLAGEVFVVAPERKWTAASHQLSFDRTLTLSRRGERVFACSGAPADCVVAAMTLVFADGTRPDLVLAGINDKLNVGEDLAYSGTMAIAREASFWGVPSIAMSRDTPSSASAAEAEALARLLKGLWQARADWHGPGLWLALNLPERLPAPLVAARVGRDKIGGVTEIVESTPERIAYRLVRGRPATSSPGDERAAVERGAIALTRHRWYAEAPLAPAALAELDRALR